MKTTKKCLTCEFSEVYGKNQVQCLLPADDPNSGCIHDKDGNYGDSWTKKDMED